MGSNISGLDVSQLKPSEAFASGSEPIDWSFLKDNTTGHQSDNDCLSDMFQQSWQGTAATGHATTVIDTAFMQSIDAFRGDDISNFLAQPQSNVSSKSNTSAVRLPASGSTGKSSRKRSPESLYASDQSTVKRQRNTEAARRYRQRKVDRLTELEEALAKMTTERDDFRLRLAKAEAERDVLRGIISGKD